MKIAIIDTTIDGEIIGGAQTFLPKLLTGLIEKGNEVHLITADSPNEKILKPIEVSKVVLHTNIWNRSKFVEESTPILANWLNNLNPDIYLISVSPDIGWVVLPLLNPNIATLTIGHTDSATFYLPAKHYHKFITRAIGVSPEICASYVTECHIHETAVEWIPYGVEVRESAPNPDRFLKPIKLIYVGRLEEEQKRVSDLIKIIKLLSKNNLDYQFSIVGDGEEMPKIKTLLSQEIEMGKVILDGWLDSTSVLEKMRQSDIFVLTSAYEGFCISLVESMANGCCPVVTNIRSGNKELINDEKTGFLLEVGATEQFVEKIKWLAHHPKELLKMRQLAWEKGQEYSILKMVDNYQKCFEAAIFEAQNVRRQLDTSFPLVETCRSRYPLWMRRIKKMIKGTD